MNVNMTSAPLLNAAFDKESIRLVQVPLALDASETPTVDTSFLMYSSEKIKILFSFYGKERADTYAGHTLTSPALISCTTESLSLEYGGYKNYVPS